MEQSRRRDQSVRQYWQTYADILDTMIREMTQAPLTDSISHNFMVQMIPHHRAAIAMSRSILSYTTVPELREIARNIITEQTKSIENMRQILCFCGGRTNSSQERCLYQGQMNRIMHTMFTQMKQAHTTDRVSCDFMWEMIPHHRGAVEMSGNALRFSLCPELVPILQAIITSQKKGIAQMQALLCKLDC